MTRLPIPRRTFYMARHGETEDNATDTVTKRKAKLTDKGAEQARELRHVIGEIFARAEDCYLVDSGLPRARVTSALAMPEKWSIEHRVDDRLNERNSGIYAGKISAAGWVELQASHVGREHEMIGVESVNAHTRRVGKALRHHLAECPEYQTPLFVCHYGTLRRTAALLGHKIEHFDNGGLYKFEPEGEGGWKVSRMSIENEKLHEVAVASEPMPVVKRTSPHPSQR